MRDSKLQSILDMADDKVSLAIDLLETSITYDDSLSDEDKEELQDFVDKLEDIRGDINI